MIRSLCAAIVLAASLLAPAAARAAVTDSSAPLRTAPGLVSITFWERSGGSGPDAYTFAASSPQLAARLSALSSSSYDFATIGNEVYDVFYSNADGTPTADGGFLSVEAVFTGTDPTNGGLNLAEVQLNFSDGTSQLAGGVASFVRQGVNSYPDRIPTGVDGNFSTHTSMGNTTSGAARLRLTVSFHRPTALASLPGLGSVTVYERSGGASPTAYTFAVGDSRLTAQRAGLLNTANNDFSTPGNEYCDVFWSTASGAASASGAFFSVEAAFAGTSLTNGGLNLAEVQLNFTDGTTRLARGVSSFVYLGGNSYPDRIPSAVDGTLVTHTSMGNSSGLSQRLRLTVGF